VAAAVPDQEPDPQPWPCGLMARNVSGACCMGALCGNLGRNEMGEADVRGREG
jgi:hypothetical protein